MGSELFTIIKSDSSLLKMYQSNVWFATAINKLMESSTGADRKSCVLIIADLAYALENGGRTRNGL